MSKGILTAEERARIYNDGNGLAYPFDESAPKNHLLDGLAAYWTYSTVEDKRGASHTVEEALWTRHKCEIEGCENPMRYLISMGSEFDGYKCEEHLWTKTR